VGPVDALLREGGHLGQVDAVVDAERQGRVGERMGVHGPAGREQDRDHVGEVHLALGVVGPEPAERLAQRGRVEGVEAGVDLAQGELLDRRVARHLRLDDPRHAAVAGPDDASVSRRVVQLHRGERRARPRLGVERQERGDRLGGDERHVAVDDEHRAVVALVQERGGGRHRVARPTRLGLHGDLDVRREVLLEPPLRVVHHDHAPGARVAGRRERPQQHRPPADRVQDLRLRGPHPGSLARGEEHDRGDGGHVAAS
jgi:hypothetical protein